MKAIHSQLDDLLDAATAFRPLVAELEAAGHMLAAVLAKQGKILTCGNGGSATDALHLSEELVGRFDGNRRSLAAVCLSADAALLTCIANDFGYDAVFSRQIEGLGHMGDALVVFSTSGNSMNCVQALHAAKRVGLKTVTVLGKDGGKCRGLSEHELIVPSPFTARVQEMHTFILHAWLTIIEAELGLA